MTLYTKQNLDELWNAIEYTRATMSSARTMQSTEELDWGLVHRGRAHQSMAFLDNAIKLVNQMRKELKDE